MLSFRVTSPGTCKAGFSSALIFLLAAAASGQSAPRKSLPSDHLERFDESPMFIFRKEASAAMVSQHGPFTSYQVNVGPNGQNITADAANEPSIAVDPTNPNKMAIGWRQFDSVFSNFRQAGYGYTTNGGASWTFPGVLENVFRSDPVLAPNATGNFFYLSLLQTSPRLFEVQQSPRFMLLKMLQSFVELDMLGFSPEHEQPIHLA